MLVDEEEVEEAKEEGARALKRRKKLEASALAPMDMSSEGIQSVELLEHLTAKTAKDAREGSSSVCALSLGAAKLLRGRHDLRVLLRESLSF